MWLVLTVVAIAAVLGAVVLVGYLLPIRHEARSSVVLKAPPQAVWDLLTSFDRAPEWRNNVLAVERLPNSGDRPVWRETYVRGEAVAFELLECNPCQRMVRRIADSNLPFGGTWTIEVQLEDSGTRVSITELGDVYNPIFRFVSRFVIGHTTTLNKFLADMSQALEPHNPHETRVSRV